MTIAEIFETIRDWAVGKFQPKGDYAASSDIPTKISELKNDKGYLTEESDPTVPEWAKQPAKPVYSKSDVGLGNVDNTTDIGKPVSTAQQTAIDAAYQQATGYTDQVIADLINGAPSTLDTLGEIAAAMQENSDVVDALETAIGTKANQTELDGHVGNNTIHLTASERQSWNGKQTMTGDVKDNIVTFTSGDSLNPIGYTDVGLIASGEKQSSLWNKISLFAKNVRYLWKLLGSTSLSGIGDGTVTGAISSLNTGIAVTLSNTIGLPKHEYIENDGFVFTIGKLAIFSFNAGLSGAFPVMQTVPIIYGLPAAAYTQFAVFYSNGNPVRVCVDDQGILSIYLPHTDVVGELAGEIVYLTK